MTKKQPEWEEELWHDLLTGLGLENEDADIAINIIKPFISQVRQEAIDETLEKEREKMWNGIFDKLEKYSCKSKNLIGQPETKVVRLDMFKELKKLIMEEVK